MPSRPRRPGRAAGRAAPDEGVGVALGYWPGATNPASAACRVSPDGSVQVMTGVADMSGVAGGFQAIVADALGIAPDAVQIVTLDSDGAPGSPGSGGSTITYSAGRAIRSAAEEVGKRLLAAAALQLEIAVEDLELVDGAVRPRGTPEKAIPIAKLVRAHARAGRAPIEAQAGAEEPSLAPSVAGHVVRVRVDRETGAVDGPAPTTSSRTSGGCSTRPSSSGSSTARPCRASAGRPTSSSSTTRTASS